MALTLAERIEVKNPLFTRRDVGSSGAFGSQPKQGGEGIINFWYLGWTSDLSALKVIMVRKIGSDRLSIPFSAELSLKNLVYKASKSARPIKTTPLRCQKRRQDD
jgi:hypothetical protein